MEGNNKAGFSGLVLAGMAHIGKIDMPIVKKAIETVTHKKVDEWIKKNIGKTVHAKRCECYGKPIKQIVSIINNISKKMGQVFSGFSEGIASGF